jgi:hypothetical protein
MRCGFQRCVVLVARTLPPHSYDGNAYSRSVLFEAASGTLFVRVERLENVGDFTVVLTHALAHVKVGSMINDSDPKFVAEFHRGLQLLCENLFERVEGRLKP